MTKSKLDLTKKHFGKASTPTRTKKVYPKPFSFRPANEEERERIIRAAEGMSVSAYFRQCIAVAEGKKIRRSALQNRAGLAQVLALLGQREIADNLKRLRYLADNGALLLEPDTLDQLNKACIHVQEIRRVLVAALGVREGRQK
ncbi:MAG: hypothetical protein OIF54_05925 [Cohaesibacter sp.]|nr:hypothetical protein [Cohaesibacter sp.]